MKKAGIVTSIVICLMLIAIIFSGCDDGINKYLISRKSNNALADSYATTLGNARIQETSTATALDNNGIDPTVPAGYMADYKKVTCQMGLDDITSWGTNHTMVYPGNIIKIADIKSNDIFSPIVGLKRAPAKIVMGLEGSTGTGSLIENVTEVNLASITEATHTLVSRNIVPDAQLPLKISTSITEVRSSSEFALAAGMSIKGGGNLFSASLAANCNVENNEKATYAVFMLKQVYYTIAFNYPSNAGAKGFFSNETTLEQVQNAINAGDIPAYVSSVTYGRIAAITIQSNYSMDVIRTKMTAGLKTVTVNGKTTIDASSESNFEGMELNYFIYGGSIEGNQNVLSAVTQSEMISTLNSDYNPIKIVGVPISYTLSHLGDGSPARLGNYSEYYLKKLTPIPVTEIKFPNEDISIADKDKFENKIFIGNTILLNAKTLPETAVLYPPRFLLLNTLDADDKPMAEITDSNGYYSLKISNQITNVGKEFAILVEVGEKGTSTYKSIIKTYKIKVESFTVTFMDGENVFLTMKSDQYGKIDPTMINSPTKEGYHFSGWYTDKNYTNKYDFSLNHISAATTLYAKWANAPCYLTYQSFYENGDERVDITEKGVILTSFAVPEKTGYNFNGWYKDNELTEKAALPFTISGNLTLYPKWTEIEYKITFISNGGAQLPTQIYTILTAIDLPIPTRSSHEFQGWYCNFDFTDKKITVLTKGNMGDITLYAKWYHSEVIFSSDNSWTVKDDDKNQFTNYSLIPNFSEEELRYYSENGYKIKITLSLDIVEVNDGYQEIYVSTEKYINWSNATHIFAPSSILWAVTNHETVRGGKGKGTLKKDIDLTVNQIIALLNGSKNIFITFGANGGGGDTWIASNLSVKVTFYK